MRNPVTLVAFLFLLSACSMFSPVKSEPLTTYLINAAPQPQAQKRNPDLILLVNLPDGNSVYNSTAIAYTTHPYQIGYFVKSTWAETPTQMLQAVIIQTLQRTHHFRLVGSSASVSQYGYILNTHLVKLVQDFSRTPHLLHFILRAELINATSNQVIASKEFNVDELIPCDDTYSGVVATNRAVSRVMSQLARFTLRNLA